MKSSIPEIIEGIVAAVWLLVLAGILLLAITLPVLLLLGWRA